MSIEDMMISLFDFSYGILMNTVSYMIVYICVTPVTQTDLGNKADMQTKGIFSSPTCHRLPNRRDLLHFPGRVAHTLADCKFF